MAEQTDEFRRRAFRAAGPVFFVATGIVALAVLAVLALLTSVPPGIGLGLGIVGVASLALGIALAVADGRPRTERG